MSRLRRWKKRKCSLLIPALTRWAKVCRAYGAGRNAKFSLLLPALTRWANLCRASGAGRNANAPFSSQRLRAGLKYAAPPALERGRAGTARRKGGGRGIPAAARNLRCRAPTRTAAEGGVCRRRDLSRREDGRRVRRASGGPGGRECAENPGPDGRPCACC